MRADSPLYRTESEGSGSMRKFIIAPEGCRWSEREAQTARTAYELECSWINPGTRTAVIDAETGAAQIFTREIETNGNLKAVNEII